MKYTLAQAYRWFDELPKDEQLKLAKSLGYTEYRFERSGITANDTEILYENIVIKQQPH